MNQKKKKQLVKFYPLIELDWETLFSMCSDPYSLTFPLFLWLFSTAVFLGATSLNWIN